MNRISVRCFVIFFIVAGALSVSATLLPFPSPLPKVSTSYDSILLKTWQGIKKRNVDPENYKVKMIHRPYSESPGDMVSEGVGYGMLLALYCNDQEYFNKIWDAGESNLWSSMGNCYNWRMHLDGKVEPGAATDAEEDIALCLIFADLLAKKGYWTAHTSPKGVTYAQRANILINNIWEKMVEGGIYLKPGDSWGGKDLLNPGYFAPAWYRIFDEFEEQDHNWKGLIDECYKIIAKSSGYAKGLIPDFMNFEGVAKAAGYNTYAGSQHLYKDAIRIYWRIGTDYLWYNEPRAKTFLDNAVKFIESPDRANFFQINGAFLPDTDSFKLGNEVSRPRKEHSHLTVGMWACAAIAAGSMELAEAFSDELLKFYEPGADYWGKSSDPLNGEDTLHNEMYFDQFLAWYGASMVSGIFTNLWEDLKDPDPTLQLAWEKAPSINSKEVNAAVAPLLINGIFNKPAKWSVSLSSETSTDSRLFTGSGETLSVNWNGLSFEGKPMTQGWYNVKITARTLTEPCTMKVWLAKSFDLKEGNRLLVDDFRDDDLIPFIGNRWQSFTDNHDGGKSGAKKFEIFTEDSKHWITWVFKLDKGNLGFDPYAALEWDCTTANGNLDLNGLDTIIIHAKSEKPLGIGVQLITTNVSDYNFFQDSLNLTTIDNEYKLPISAFKPRFGGNGSPDLSKLTSIRFQLQMASGTENSIMISKMSFTGKLDKLYTAPPAYIPISVIEKNQVLKNMQVLLRYTSSNKGILFSSESQIYGATIALFDISGRFIGKVVAQGKQAFIPLSKSNVAKKVFIAQIEHRGRKSAIKISVPR